MKSPLAAVENEMPLKLTKGALGKDKRLSAPPKRVAERPVIVSAMPLYISVPVIPVTNAGLTEDLVVNVPKPNAFIYLT